MGKNTENWVLTFSEKTKGWVSFKSFTPMQFAISMANNYYTFDGGELFEHYNESVDRNTFYGTFSDSSIDVMLNDKPGLVKVFNTLNYEGSQSKVARFIHPTNGTLNLPFQPQTVYSDQDYYNLVSKAGWSVKTITTDLEEGNVNEFLGKEGKWFNNINRVIDIALDVADSSDFTFQGIGEVMDILIDGEVPVYGCTDILAMNYDSLANANDGSCDYLGCTNPLSSNYDPNATVDDGSCTDPPRFGCTDSTAINYDASANIDDGSCVYEPSDCVKETQSGALCSPNSGVTFSYGSTLGYGIAAVVLNNGSYWTLATGVSGSTPGVWIQSEWTECCEVVVEILGCTDVGALNYNPSATVNDGSCLWDLGGLAPGGEGKTTTQAKIIPTGATKKTYK